MAQPNLPRARVERRTHKERTDLSDKLMLDAARDLILEVGTARTTLQAVGERAGYSRGLAHARFGNKEAMFLQLAQRCFENWVGELTKASNGKTGLDALLSQLDAVTSYAKRHPGDARTLYILWFESVSTQSEMHDALARFHERARQQVKALIREGQTCGTIDSSVDPTGFSLHFTSSIFGFCYQWVTSPTAVSVTQFTRHFKQLVHTALTPRNA